MPQLTLEIHRLRHPQTGQYCTLIVTHDQVSIDTETNGKTRRTEKRFATAAEADHYAEQQEWTRLKKGLRAAP